MRLVKLSELTTISKSLNLIGVFGTERFVDVVRVCDVFSALDHVRVEVTLSKDLLASDLVFSHHLNTKDVVDFDVMSREAVVQEVWWENHAVTSVPEFGSILMIEMNDITVASETESRD